MGDGRGLSDGLNDTAQQIFQRIAERAGQLSVLKSELPCGAQLLDFGVAATGGLAAGLEMATLCTAGRASVSLVGGDRATWPGAWVQVVTDQPVEACMLSQYAGWPVKHESFFAIASGPMRVRRGREALLEDLGAKDASSWAVGTLECDQLPTNEVALQMAQECSCEPAQLLLGVAPTRSIAGCVQVVARSVETSLHKLHELGFDLNSVRSAYGLAPVPPPTPDFALGIGRTNDAILFAGQVSLWIEGDDEQLSQLGSQLPSSCSADFGEPFADIFKRYDYDFYKIDPGLFSPAQVTLFNLRSGRSWCFGSVRGDLLSRSFETQRAGV